VYAPRIGDQALDFGHRGWLYEESFLFYDYQTDSLWVQATGEAVAGLYKGKKLDRLPATQTIWKEWRQLHPETLVLSRPQEKNSRYWRNSYDRTYATGKGIQYDRHKPLTFGVAIVTDAAQKLYPFSELQESPVLVDQVASNPVLVIFHHTSHTAVAWDPRYQGHTLEFDSVHVLSTDITLTDRQTGSRWSGLTGRCFAGPAQGAQLRQLTTTQFVVENWPLHYPDASIYQGY
jgi:hypothetical protein